MSNEKQLQSILSNEEVKKLALEVLDETSTKLIERINDKFYSVIEYYLDDHHAEYVDKIFNEVFRFICGSKWSKYRDTYDAKKLRANLYKENKEDIDKLMMPQLVEEEIKRYFRLFLSDEEVTDWRYRDLEIAVTKWIYDNFDNKFSKLKKLLPEKIIKENERMQRKVDELGEELSEIKDEGYNE